MIERILKSDKSAWYAMVLLLLMFLPYFYLSFFVHPAADDYNYACLTLKNDWISAYISRYYLWSGRYTSNALFLINPIAYKSLLIYRFVPIILILLTILSAYFLFSSVFRSFFRKIVIINLSLSLTFFYLYTMPDIAEGIYWYTGAVVYQLSLISGLIYLSLFYRYLTKKFLFGKIVDFLLMLILLIIIVGFNEIIMLLMLFFHFLFLLNSLYRNKTNRSLSAILFLMVSCLSLVMILAPGNDMRASYFEHHHEFFKSVVFSILQTFRFLCDWISNLPLVIFSLLFIIIIKPIIGKFEFFRGVSLKMLIICSLCIPLVIFLSVFPAYWSTGILGQHRTLNVALFFFLLLWLINLILWTNYYQEHPFFIHLEKIFSKNVFIVLFSISIITMIFTRNGYNAFSDIIYGKAQGFNKEMNDRYVIISKSRLKPEGTVVFNPLKNRPATIFVMDLNSDSAHWANDGFASYYKIKNVIIK